MLNIIESKHFEKIEKLQLKRKKRKGNINLLFHEITKKKKKTIYPAFKTILKTSKIYQYFVSAKSVAKHKTSKLK